MRDEPAETLSACLASVRGGGRLDTAALHRAFTSQHSPGYRDQRLLADLTEACRSSGRSSVAALAKALERALATFARQEIKADLWGACEALAKLGVDVSFAEPLARSTLKKSYCDLLVDSLVRLLAQRDRPAAIRIYREVLTATRKSPTKIFPPPEAILADVAEAAIRTFAHLGPAVIDSSVSIGTALRSFFCSTASQSVATALVAASTDWRDSETAAFIEVVLDLYYDDEALRRRDAILRLALPAMRARRAGAWTQAPNVKRILAKLRGGDAKRLRLPPRWPLDLDAALELRAKYDVSAEDLGMRPPPKARSTAAAAKALGRSLPRDVAELYGCCDGLGRAVAPVASLKQLQRRFASEIREHLEEADAVSAPDLDVHSFLPIAETLAIGNDFNGDTFFVDPRRRTKEGTMPLFRFVHDAACTVRPEAASAGAFVAARILERWAEREGENQAFGKQLTKERTRANPTPRKVKPSRGVKTPFSPSATARSRP